MTICANCMYSKQEIAMGESETVLQRIIWYCMHPNSKTIDYLTGKTITATFCTQKNTHGECPDYEERKK